MLPKNRQPGKELILYVVSAITAIAVLPIICNYRGKVVIDAKPAHFTITVEAVEPCRQLSTSCKTTSP